MAATIGVGVIVFVKWWFVFESGNLAGGLVLTSMICGCFSLVLALLSFPRIQNIVALIMCAFLAYLILFTPIYAIP